MRYAHSSFPRPSAPGSRAARAGSTMVVALLTVFVLSLVAANVLSSISARYNSAYRSASWNEALLTADTGIDMILAEIARQIPDVTLSSVSGLGTGVSQTHTLPDIQLLQFSNGTLPSLTLLQLKPDQMTHAGEGGTTQSVTVALDVVPLSQLLAGGVTGVLDSVTGLLNGGDVQLLRLRSIGTVQLTGGGTAGISRLDNELWRPSIFTDVLTGAKISTPQISRQVEVMLRPVHPYEAAVVSDGAVLAPKAGTVIDSFNSLLPTASTLGKYDSFKRLTNGAVRANSNSFTMGGTVYGDVGTNGGSVVKDAHVTGDVSNSAYVPLPLINVPSWTPTTIVIPDIFRGNTSTVYAGTILTPARAKLSGITGTLNIKGPGTNVELYVDGDVTGTIVVDPGVTVKLYVTGSVNTKASNLRNGSNVASALQIYGIYKDASSTPSIRLNMDTTLAAAIYAPGHKVYLDGQGDFSGSIVGSRFEASDAARVHYDEALAYNVGPLLRYQIASWQEITN